MNYLILVLVNRLPSNYLSLWAFFEACNVWTSIFIGYNTDYQAYPIKYAISNQVLLLWTPLNTTSEAQPLCFPVQDIMESSVPWLLLSKSCKVIKLNFVGLLWKCVTPTDASGAVLFIHWILLLFVPFPPIHNQELKSDLILLIN